MYLSLDLLPFIIIDLWSSRLMWRGKEIFESQILRVNDLIVCHTSPKSSIIHKLITKSLYIGFQSRSTLVFITLKTPNKYDWHKNFRIKVSGILLVWTYLLNQPP